MKDETKYEKQSQGNIPDGKIVKGEDERIYVALMHFIFYSSERAEDLPPS